MNHVKRRDVLKGAAAGALAMWAPRLPWSTGRNQAVTRLTDKLAVIDAGGANVTAFQYRRRPGRGR